MRYGVVTKKIILDTDEGLDLSFLLYEGKMSNLAAVLTYHMAIITWLEQKGGQIMLPT